MKRAVFTSILVIILAIPSIIAFAGFKSTHISNRSRLIYPTFTRIMAPTKRKDNSDHSHQSKKIKPRQASMFDFLSSPSSLQAKPSNENEGILKKDNKSIKLYCDLDGVLVDFAAGVRKVCNGNHPDEIDNKGWMWSAICSSKSFYSGLPWTDDGKELWDAILPHSPTILTGVPMFKASRVDKYQWCKRELGVEVNHVDMAASKRGHDVVSGSWRRGVVNIITCWSANKHEESGERRILIDDTERLAHNWIERGGIFILHVNTKDTLEKLREAGVLPDDASSDEVKVKEGA